MLAILKRILDSIVALLMICLSLIFQGFFFLLLSWGVVGVIELMGHEVESDATCYLVMLAGFVLFNSLAFVAYFKHGKANMDLGSDASAFFLIPRAVDTIVSGSQRVLRETEQSGAGGKEEPPNEPLQTDG